MHVDGARKIAKLAKENGVSKFIHVSAMNANPLSDSLFLKSKVGSRSVGSYSLRLFAKLRMALQAYGEQAVLAEFPDATIVRPATMYGAEDRFFQRWSSGYSRTLQLFNLQFYSLDAVVS